jgi:hypothetical protein
MTHKIVLSLVDYNKLMRYLAELHSSAVEQEASRQGYDLMDFTSATGATDTVALIKDMRLHTDTFSINKLLPQSITLKKGVLYGKNKNTLRLFQRAVNLEGKIHPATDV